MLPHIDHSKALRAKRNKRFRQSAKGLAASRKQLDTRITSRRQRPFIGWDGEGTREFTCAPDGMVTETQNYSLFGNNDGDIIIGRSLGTAECLDLILECEMRIPDAIHVGFATEYDVNMILKDLPWRCLAMLRHFGATDWEGYEISHIPNKWFTVKRDGIQVKLFNVFSFFACSYIKALDEFEIGTKEDRDFIKAGKDQRAVFSYLDIKYIRSYWEREISLLPALMDNVRKVFDGGGYKLTSWHGPGALARLALTQHKVRDIMKESPGDVWLAARYAYTGGRFEQFQAGYHDGEIYNYDINSAYPYAITYLPDLTTGAWHHRGDNLCRDDIQPDTFALYKIRYDYDRCDPMSDPMRPMPLFKRSKNDCVSWRGNVEGWYWGPEAYNVKNDPCATFLDCWEYVYDGAKPFHWVHKDYDRRLFLKSIGSPLQLGTKLQLNSIYGQFAQRVGWQHNGKAPSSHQLEWAGYITSMCKAMVQRAATYAYSNDSLVSIDTDGLYTTAPIPADILSNGIGKALGQWEQQTYTGILHWQSGIYWLRNRDREWNKPKSRGTPSANMSIDMAWEALPSYGDLHLSRKNFIGYKLALQGRYDTWRTWEDQTIDIAFAGGSGSKRYHPYAGVLSKGCKGCQNGGGLHRTIPTPEFVRDQSSCMHNLPWIDNDHMRPYELDQGLFDMIWDKEML